jgi:adenylate cyclase class 2
VRTARRLLRAAGFAVSRKRVFESNVIFDTPKLALRRGGAVLRLRQAGTLTTVTYKGPPLVARYKSREELELEIGGRATMHAIFERLGFRPVFRYEKFRTEYRQGRGAGMATLDETPVGMFVELEGPPRWIDRTARQMGLGEGDYITSSSAHLYLDWCREKRVKAANMVFG